MKMITNVKRGGSSSSTCLRFIVISLIIAVASFPIVSSFTSLLHTSFEKKRISTFVTSHDTKELIIIQNSKVFSDGDGASTNIYAHFCLGVLLSLSYVGCSTTANALDIPQVPSLPSLQVPTVPSAQIPTLPPVNIQNLPQVSIPATPDIDIDKLAPGIKIWSSKFNESRQRFAEEAEANRKLKAEEKAANIAKYDEMFQKDIREDSAYYGKIALESMKRAEEMQIKESKNMEPVKGYNEGKSFLVEQLAEEKRSTEGMSTIDLREYQKQQKILQRRIELEESLQKLRADQAEVNAEVRAREQINYEKQQLSIQRAEEAKKREELEFEERMIAKQKALEEIKDRQSQKIFEARLKILDSVDEREEQFDVVRQNAKATN